MNLVEFKQGNGTFKVDADRANEILIKLQKLRPYKVPGPNLHPIKWCDCDYHNGPSDYVDWRGRRHSPKFLETYHFHPTLSKEHFFYNCQWCSDTKRRIATAAERQEWMKKPI